MIIAWNNTLTSIGMQFMIQQNWTNQYNFKKNLKYSLEICDCKSHNENELYRWFKDRYIGYLDYKMQGVWLDFYYDKKNNP